MIRQSLIHSGGTKGETNFRWRGTEVTRLEGFSDAVFGFSVTLLVVSLEVPKTFPELMQAVHGFLSFGMCFALLSMVWYQHFRFFRRYALQDGPAIVLNLVLLFFVLFYVYPLKFLFGTLFADEGQVAADQARVLFVVYGVGYAAIFTVFALLHWHAWNRREFLALSPVESLKTRHSLYQQAAMAVIGLTSALLAMALPERLLGIPGWFYFVTIPYFTLSGSFFGKRQRSLAAGSVATPVDDIK